MSNNFFGFIIKLNYTIIIMDFQRFIIFRKIKSFKMFLKDKSLKILQIFKLLKIIKYINICEIKIIVSSKIMFSTHPQFSGILGKDHRYIQSHMCILVYD